MPRIAPVTLLAGAVTGALVMRERQSRRAMERLAAATLESLLNAIDANDAETGAHVRRVAAYALVLADEAGLDEHSQRIVERVALFHDIGKIHAALFDIIHEETRLTAAERRAIATHPARGAAVLAPIAEFYPDLTEGVLAHHERWDGKGYPDKLRGPRIPLAARIVAIADTFDVVSHGRRYQRSRSLDHAAEVIARGRGTQFDPNLVDLFLFPPVFARVRDAGRTLGKPRVLAPPMERRDGSAEPEAPDVPFRWRTRTGPNVAGAAPSEKR
ncbi:MAG TPA: HD domain-containing phosphohydrolase [Gemmatimonadaceae bacterium]|nr:HD domain-containing phosphohydrolase [Gemmatimonadaceae bacterium]